MAIFVRLARSRRWKPGLTAALMAASTKHQPDASYATCRAPSLEALGAGDAKPPGAWCATNPACAAGADSDYAGDAADANAYAEDGAVAVALRLTLNGNLSDCSAPVHWAYFDDALPRPMYLTPRGGPRRGGTQVRIVGAGLLAYGEVLCHFQMPEGAGRSSEFAWVVAKIAPGRAPSDEGVVATGRSSTQDVIPDGWDPGNYVRTFDDADWRPSPDVSTAVRTCSAACTRNDCSAAALSALTVRA